MRKKPSSPLLESGATIIGPYRYKLWRTWSREVAPVTFIMLNPSTATGEVDDPTIRRCIGFARAWKKGGILVVNLFAFRTPSPKMLAQADSPVGPDNDRAIQEAASASDLIVAAWGIHGTRDGRDQAVHALLRKQSLPMYCLGLTASGNPRHPLLLKEETPLQLFHPEWR